MSHSNLVYRRKYDYDRYHYLVALNLCPRCGLDADDDRVVCSKCRELDNASHRRATKKKQEVRGADGKQ